MTNPIGHPDKPFDDFLSVFRSRCNTLNNRAFLLFVGMFLAYYGIVQMSLELTEYDTAHNAVIEAQKTKNQIISKIAQRQKTNTERDVIAFVNENNVLDYATPSEQKAFDTQDGIFAEEKAKKSKIKKSVVSFQILGSSVPFPTTFTPVLWWLFLLIGFVYLRYMKSHALVALAKAIYVYRTRAKLADSESDDASLRANLFDIAGTASPWLAPIRPHDIELGVGPSEIREAIGWSQENETSARILCLLVLTLFLVFGLHVLWLGFELTDTSRPAVSNALGVSEPFSLGMRSVLVFTVAAAIYQGWLILTMDGENTYLQQKGIVRRELLQACGLGIVGVVMFNLFRVPYVQVKLMQMSDMLPSNRPRLFGRPRFIRRTVIRSYQTQDLKSGFYRQSDTSIVHFVTCEGMIRHVSNIDEAKLRPVVLEPKLLTFLHPLTFSHVVERAVLMLFKDGKVDASLELLRWAIALQQEEPWRLTRSGRPSFRLYDLLAGVAVRYGRSDYQAIVGSLAEEAMRGRRADRVTSERLSRCRAAWSDPSSAWHKKWTNTSEAVTWRLPIGTDRSAGKPKARFEAVEFVDREARSL